MANTVDVEEKSRLRREALARRKALPAEIRDDASSVIAERAISLIRSVRPASVALYWSFGSECATSSLISAVAETSAEVGLPVVLEGRGLEFRRYIDGDHLVAGAFGILEPARDAPSVQPEFIVAPVVAFDRFGMRLGYGRGHYDSAITRLREAGQQPRLLGIAFSVQEVQSIPAECHDVRLDYVATEKETLEFRTKGG